MTNSRTRPPAHPPAPTHRSWADSPSFRPVRGAPPPPAPPLFECTGENATLNGMAYSLNQLAQFREPPPAHQGAVGVVAHALGTVMAAINAPVQLLETGFSLVIAPLSAAFPALPAATMGDLHLGAMHAHTHPPSLVPPAPPVPLPSIGTVLLPCAINVLICGVPAARAGDVGLAVTCGSFAPPFEIYTGSSSVMIGGARAARLGDITKHDSPPAPTPDGAPAPPPTALQNFMAGLQGRMATAGYVAGALGIATGLQDSANSDAQAAAATEAAEAERMAAEAAGQALGAGLAAAQLAADLAGASLHKLIGKDMALGPGLGLLVSTTPTVLIGGFPMPNVLDLAKGLAKLARGLAGRARRRIAIAGCRTCRGG